MRRSLVFFLMLISWGLFATGGLRTVEISASLTEDVRLFVDGKYITDTLPVYQILGEGLHLFEIYAKGYNPHKAFIEVTEEKQKIELHLERSSF